MDTTPPSPSPAPDASRRERFGFYRLFWWVAVSTLALDQLSKFWIVHTLPIGSYGPGRHIAVIDGFFHLVHVGNTGAAWSLFSGGSLWLAGLAILTLAGIYHWRHSLGLRQRGLQIAFGLLCGGIVGNGIDRLAYQHVVDFLDFHFGSYIYPTFNIADSGIVCGVVLYFFLSLKKPADTEEAEGTE